MKLKYWFVIAVAKRGDLRFDEDEMASAEPRNDNKTGLKQNPHAQVSTGIHRHLIIKIVKFKIDFHLTII